MFIMVLFVVVVVTAVNVIVTVFTESLSVFKCKVKTFLFNN